MTDTTDIAVLYAMAARAKETGTSFVIPAETAMSMLTHIGVLRDNLEAERQRADHNKVMQLAAEDVSASALRDWSSEGIKLHAANEEIKRLTAEIAALKGEQVPDGYIFCHPDGKLFWSIVSESCANGKGVVPYYLTRRPSSVVVLPRKIEPWEVIDILDPTANPEDYACCVGADMYNAAIKACRKSVQDAGGIVKDGEL